MFSTAMPLTVGDRLVGVLTLYSNKERAFDVRVRQLVEGFAAYLGPWLDEPRAAAGAYPQKGATSRDGPKPVAELRSLQDHKRDRVQAREPNLAVHNLASSQ